MNQSHDTPSIIPKVQQIPSWSRRQEMRLKTSRELCMLYVNVLKSNHKFVNRYTTNLKYDNCKHQKKQ